MFALEVSDPLGSMWSAKTYSAHEEQPSRKSYDSREIAIYTRTRHPYPSFGFFLCQLQVHTLCFTDRIKPSLFRHSNFVVFMGKENRWRNWISPFCFPPSVITSIRYLSSVFFCGVNRPSIKSSPFPSSPSTRNNVATRPLAWSGQNKCGIVDRIVQPIADNLRFIKLETNGRLNPPVDIW